MLDRAHNAILLSLGDGVLREVGRETTAARLWKSLKAYIPKRLWLKG